MLTTKIRVAESSVDIENLGKETAALNELPLHEYKSYGEIEPEAGKSKGFLIPNNPWDITGGYLIEQDHAERLAEETSGFATKQGNGFAIKEPQFASKEQAEYIRGFVQELTEAIVSEDGKNAETDKSYKEYIDTASFVKNYIIQEVTKNMDMNLTSQFFYKPRGTDSVLYAGPVWDFDYTFGMADAIIWDTALNDPGDLLDVKSYEAGNPGFSFGSLYRQKDFQEAVVWSYRNEFRERLQHLLNTGIDECMEQIEESAAMHHSRWENEEGQQEAVANIKKFLEQRIQYLDSVW